MSGCVFCEILEHHPRPESRIKVVGTNFFTLEPLKPHVPGHLLVVPKTHVTDACQNPALTGQMFEHAARILRFNGGDGNILTSVGERATQTVMHLHVHILPRNREDGLHFDWPWMRSI